MGSFICVMLAWFHVGPESLLFGANWNRHQKATLCKIGDQKNLKNEINYLHPSQQDPDVILRFLAWLESAVPTILGFLEYSCVMI